MVGTHSDGLDEADTMVKVGGREGVRGGREGGREGGLAYLEGAFSSEHLAHLVLTNRQVVLQGGREGGRERITEEMISAVHLNRAPPSLPPSLPPSPPYPLQRRLSQREPLVL
jgi:hypothetical protein